MAGLHKVLISECKEGIVMGRGIKLKGFLHLHKIFIEKNRPETLWKICQAFGYDRDLQLHIPNIACTPPQCDMDQNYVLTKSGCVFLNGLFRLHDKNGDGILSIAEIKEICFILPHALPPWTEEDSFIDAPKLIASNSIDDMTLSIWIALWR